MKVKRKPKLHIPTKYILLLLTCLCVGMLFFSFAAMPVGSPLNDVAGYVFVPMQKGINVAGSWLRQRADSLKSLQEAQRENAQLREKIAELQTELNTGKLEQYELENLRKLWELDQKYPGYQKVGARVISRDSGNWFSSFLIDKGRSDGIEKDMNVIAGGGLVGIVTDVGPNYARVRAIIDDASNVSGSTLSTEDYCVVSGNLLTMNESQAIEFSELKCEEGTVAPGEQIVTSNISDKYLQGILIGYLNTIERDSNHLTCSGTITPAVDFAHLEEVLVILEKKQQVEE